MDAITIERVSKRFHNTRTGAEMTVLDDVSLTVRENDFLCL